MTPPIPTAEPRSWKPESAADDPRLQPLVPAEPGKALVPWSSPVSLSRLELKSKPTNADLQMQNVELHGCIHATDARLSALAMALKIDLPTRDELEKGVQPKIHSRLGSLRPWKAAAAAIPVIVAALTAYHFLEPAVVAFGATLHRTLMAVH